MSEKEGITLLKYENGYMIYFNPDIFPIPDTIEISNKKDDDVEVIEDKDISNNKQKSDMSIHTYVALCPVSYHSTFQRVTALQKP
jgi:hypothetical protein